MNEIMNEIEEGTSYKIGKLLEAIRGISKK